MQAFSDMAKALNRSPVYLTGLQKRFELPTFDGALYTVAGKEMGEDALRVLRECIKIRARILADVATRAS